MKKNKKMILRFITAVLSLTLCLSMSLTVSATEDTTATTKTSTTSDSTIQPRGSLSGYGHQYTNGNVSGQFDFTVEGSWSPWAGCTVKFEGFPDGTVVTYRLVEVSSGRWMFGNSDRAFTVKSSDNDDNNIALVNVSPGTYRLVWTIVGTETGTIRCYIY